MFMLIDPMRNTLKLTDAEIKEIWKCLDKRENLSQDIQTHNNLKELYKEVGHFIKEQTK